MQSVVIPGDHTSPVRINVGQRFTEFTADSSDLDAIGIILQAGQSYRITLDPAVASLTQNMTLAESSKDPLIVDILNSTGGSLGFGDDDSGSGTAAVSIFTPTVAGTYFIVVGPGDIGWWTLEVDKFNAPPDDFSNALNPNNAISIWETRNGFIGHNGDTDTIPISLQAGVAVDITLYSNDVGLYGELADTEILNFVDATGAVVSPALLQTADALGKFTTGSGVDAHQISFTPTSTGVYFLTVGAGPGEAIGDYSVSVSAKDQGVFSIRSNEEFVATGNPQIDVFFLGAQDTHVDHIYTDRDGDGTTTLTYSVPGAGAQFSPSAHNVVNSSWTNGFGPATGVVLDTYMNVMSSISSFSKIEFVATPDTGVQAGTFRIGDTDLSIGSASGALITGWSGFPEWTMAGETWINRDKGAQNVGVIQNFGATAADLDNFLVNRTLHEFTHNLGLNHPDRSTLSGSVDPMLLGQEYSVMSRSSSGVFPDALVGDLYPQTLMWLDIQAIQAAYGVDTVTSGGADTYTFNTNDRHFSTIWDAGGNDSIVLTGSRDAIINLTPGIWQDVGTSINYYDATGSVTGVNTNTVFIAPGTHIENAQGGAGDDQITGNAASNLLTGGAGKDTLIGGAGNDDIRGEDGNDFVSGGAGDDSVRGLGGNDRVYGDDGNDTLFGHGGNDILEGRAGNDFLKGDAGNDFLIGGAGADLIQGGTGVDTADYRQSSAGVDIDLSRILPGTSDPKQVGGDAQGDVLSSIENVFGSAFNDTIGGGFTADNSLLGFAGDDFLFISPGGGVTSNNLSGGAGNDTLRGAVGGSDTLDGGAGNDTAEFFVNIIGAPDLSVDLVAGVTNFGEMLISIENIIGSSHGVNNLTGDGNGNFLRGGQADDQILGGDGADTLEAGAGDDNVLGEAGNDRVSGGTGNDVLRGNAGSDRLFGDDGNDTMLGGGGNDVLEGRNGNDFMKGDGGVDYMIGGAGVDSMFGGADNDIFIFSADGANDFIGDWSGGAGASDRIQLNGYGSAFDTFAEVFGAASQVGSRVIIDFGGGDTLTLLNTQLADLHQDDFLFT